MHYAARGTIGYRFIFVWSGLVWPGPGGLVPVARFRWPLPVARSRPGAGGLPWPGPGPCPGPGPGQVLAVYPGFGGPGPGCWPPVWSRGLGGVARSRSRSPCSVPGSQSRTVDHLCSVASFNVSRHGCAISSRNMAFYAVLQTTGERQTILRSRNHYRTKTGAKRLPKPTV